MVYSIPVQCQYHPDLQEICVMIIRTNVVEWVDCFGIQLTLTLLFPVHTANDPPKVCEDGEIRLQGGRTQADGRVEICFNDRWGTVCDDEFGREEAAVLCRQQGFSSEGLLKLASFTYAFPLIMDILIMS